MNLVHAFTQNDRLREITYNVQAYEGVCHAVTTEWVINRVQGTPTHLHDADEPWHRAISQQRAYAIRWHEALRSLRGADDYPLFLATALQPTASWVTTSARRHNPPAASQPSAHLLQLNQLLPRIQGLQLGSGIVIVMFGEGAAMDDGLLNWGHTVGVVRDGFGRYHYLDANAGQFSAGAGTGPQTAQFIVDHLEAEYTDEDMIIHDIYVYPLC